MPPPDDYFAARFRQAGRAPLPRRRVRLAYRAGAASAGRRSAFGPRARENGYRVGRASADGESFSSRRHHFYAH